MGLQRYDWVAKGCAEKSEEGGWVDANEAEAEINRLKQHAEGQVKMREENNRQWAERTRDAEEAHRKTVLSMQGDKDILMARIQELRNEIEKLKEQSANLVKQIQSQEIDAVKSCLEWERLTNTVKNLRDQDRESWSEMVSERDTTIERLQNEIRDIMEAAQKVNERDSGLLKEQLNVKDKINTELIDERDRLKRILDDTTKNFLSLRVKDSETMAELRQSILLSHTAEKRLADEIDKKLLVQKEMAYRVVELERKLSLQADEMSELIYAKEHVEDELNEERDLHCFSSRLGLAFILGALLLFVAVQIFF